MGATGFYAKAGQALCVMSAMKMETAISAPLSGWVKHVAVAKVRPQNVTLEQNSSYASNLPATACCIAVDVWTALSPLPSECFIDMGNLGHQGDFVRCTP